MNRKAVVVVVFMLFLLPFVPKASANSCLELKDDVARLQCYDEKAKAESAAPQKADITQRAPKLCFLEEDDDGRLACYMQLPEAAEHECIRKKDANVILDCFDGLAGRASPDDRFVLLPKPSESRLMIKSDAKPITVMGEFDAKPAELSIARRDGEHFVDAKVALVWQRSMSQEWSWFGAGAWTRTDKASGRKDTRGMETGLQWTRQNDSVKEGWWHVVTGSVSHKKNIADDSDATGLGLIWEFGHPSWLAERWEFVPVLGLQSERGEKGGNDYDVSTVYAIGGASWKPIDTVELFLTGGYLDDFDAGNGVIERDGDFGSIGLKYLLYDKAEKPALKPEIRLVRYFGVNPLDPDAPVNETRLTLGVLFDSIRSGK